MRNDHRNEILATLAGFYINKEWVNETLGMMKKIITVFFYDF